MSGEDEPKRPRGPPRPLLKKSTGTSGGSGDIRAVALNAYNRIQDPWGQKNTNASTGLYTLEPQEVEAYALDFALRVVWDLIRNGDDTKQCNISDNILVELRNVVLDVLKEKLPEITSEKQFVIPDPIAVDQREAQKREFAIAEMKAKQERQQKMEDERKAREIRLSQNEPSDDSSKRGRHRKKQTETDDTTQVTIEKKSSKENSNSGLDSETKEQKKSSEDVSKSKEKKKSKTSDEGSKSKKRKEKRSKSRTDDGDSEAKKKSKKKDREKSHKREKSDKKLKKDKSDSKKELTTTSDEQKTSSPESDQQQEQQEQEQEQSQQQSNPRNRIRQVPTGGIPKGARPIYKRGGQVAEEEEPLPTITLHKNLIDITKLNEFLTDRIKTSFPDLSSCESSGFLDCYHLSLRGPRPSNEDEFTLLENVNKYFELPDSMDKFSFVAVYDGHSGKFASLYARSQLHYNICKHKDFPNNLKDAIFESFKSTDKAVNEVQARENFSCGTTALAIWIRNNKDLIIGNVGDCRGFLCRDGKPLEIADPHNPSREDEKERIKACGGAVVWFGTWRVNGILAVSRSIGDYNLRSMVIPDPDITNFSIEPEDEFLLVASDGLWDGVSPEESIDIVKKTVADKGRQFVCQTLCDLAIERNTKDNVTVVILFFDHK